MSRKFRHSLLMAFWNNPSESKIDLDEEDNPKEDRSHKKKEGHITTTNSIRKRTKCMKVGTRYSLPPGLSTVTLKSYSSNIDMEDTNAKTRPWYILWKGRSFVPPKKDKDVCPPSAKTSTSSLSSNIKKKPLERTKSSKKDEAPTVENEGEDSKNSIKRKDTFRRRFSLRMRKTALRHTLSSTTTSTATSSEYPSDDGGDSDDDDSDNDDDTLVNSSMKLSSQTLSLGGAEDHFPDQEGTAHRLTQLFHNDINLIVEKAISLPDGPEKIEMIHSVLEAIKPLHNMVKLNLYFVILSSHATEEYEVAKDSSEGT